MRKKSLALTLIMAFSWLLGGGDVLAQQNLPFVDGFENATPAWTHTYKTGNGGGGRYNNSTYARNGSYSFRLQEQNNNNSQYLISPELQTTTSSLNVDFYYRNSGSTNEHKFQIGYSTSDNDTSSFTFLEEIITVPKNTNYQHYVNTLTTPNIKYIAIKYINSKVTWQYTYFDDFTIEELASCPKPTLSSSINTTCTTATISWTPSSESQELFDIYYSTISTNPTESTIPSVSNTSGTSYKITGLEPETTYYVWLRGNCGTVLDPDVSGGWTSSESFTTPQYMSLPYTCGFEGITGSKVLPPHWIRPNSTSDSYPQVSYTEHNSHSGTYCIYYTGSTSTTEQIAVLPELSTTLNGKHITLWAKGSSSIPDIQIGYMYDRNNKDDFHSLGTYDMTTTYRSITVDFGSYDNDPRFIAIKAVSTSGSIYIDDIIVYDNESAQTSDITSDTDLSEVVMPQNVSISASVTATSITLGGVLTVANGGTLTCNDFIFVGGSLTIEDGGQLILPKTSTGVQATVKKETYGATAKDTYYWFAISSAVANPSISSATNITSGTYDLYRFNEAKNAELPWENYKNTSYSETFTTLEKGRGYLYRNTEDLSIAMTGEINVADFNYSVTNSDGDLAGFNLIGNPYSHDIYKGAGTAIPNGTDFLRTGFYYMNPTTGKWTIGTDNSTAIKPNEAIFVQTDKDGNIEMTNTNANGSSKANNDNIMFKVANSQYSDEAYAWFDKGRGLNKISHRNAEVPMLYISQDGEDYAIATMNDDTKTFSLNFNAMTTGKYTLSYKTKGEFSYLHVIDRLTGEDVDMLLEGEYSFVASPSDSDERFIVRLEYTSNYGDTDSSVFAYQSGNDIIVSGEGELQVFDVTGRMVMKTMVNGIETIEAMQRGVYIFRIVGETMTTQKIIIK